MGKIDYDQKFLDKIKELKYRYEGIIPDSLRYYYKYILDGNNIDAYMQMFSLPEEDLINYARICRVMEIYEEILDLIEIMKSEMDIIESNEFLEYQGVMEELQGEGTEFLNNIVVSDDQDNEKNDYESDTNLLMYTSYIDESKQRTVNAHSGKEKETQKSVANYLEQLKKASYYSLRKKGFIHQIVQIGANRPCYVEGNAFERMGRGSTKVNYIRIPINDNNREEIKKVTNLDFEMLYLIVSYGDFANEGIDEKKYYSDIFFDFRKHIDEIVFIINLFKNNFTPETLPIALDFINEGYKITEDLTSGINNSR